MYVPLPGHPPPLAAGVGPKCHCGLICSRQLAGRAYYTCPKHPQWDESLAASSLAPAQPARTAAQQRSASYAQAGRQAIPNTHPSLAGASRHTHGGPGQGSQGYSVPPQPGPPGPCPGPHPFYPPPPHSVYHSQPPLSHPLLDPSHALAASSQYLAQQLSSYVHSVANLNMAIGAVAQGPMMPGAQYAYNSGVPYDPSRQLQQAGPPASTQSVQHGNAGQPQGWPRHSAPGHAPGQGGPTENGWAQAQGPQHAQHGAPQQPQHAQHAQQGPLDKSDSVDSLDDALWDYVVQQSIISAQQQKNRQQQQSGSGAASSSARPSNMGTAGRSTAHTGAGPSNAGVGQKRPASPGGRRDQGAGAKPQGDIEYIVLLSPDDDKQAHKDTDADKDADKDTAEKDKEQDTADKQDAAKANNKNNAVLQCITNVLSQKQEGFTCSICMDRAEETTSTPCGHVFCTACIRQSVQLYHKCPKCNKKVKLKHLFRIYLDA